MSKIKIYHMKINNKSYKLVEFLCLFLLFYTLLNHTSTPENFNEKEIKSSLYETTGSFLIASGAATVLTVVCTASSASTGVAPALYMLGGTVSGTGIIVKVAAEFALLKIHEEQYKNKKKKQKNL